MLSEQLPMFSFFLNFHLFHAVAVFLAYDEQKLVCRQQIACEMTYEICYDRQGNLIFSTRANFSRLQSQITITERASS